MTLGIDGTCPVLHRRSAGVKEQGGISVHCGAVTSSRRRGGWGRVEGGGGDMGVDTGGPLHSFPVPCNPIRNV